MNSFHRILCIIPLLFAPHIAGAQSASYRFVHGDDVLQDRNAYLLTLLERDQAARDDLQRDGVLQDIGHRLAAVRQAAFIGCQEARSCNVRPLMLAPDEIGKVGGRLAELAKSNENLRKLVREQMRPSGQFQKYSGLDDAALMRAAWTDTANGINRLYRVYAFGEPFALAEIDGPLHGPYDENANYVLDAALGSEIDGAKGEFLFAPWSRFGFDLLRMNQRDEAGRYEPLEEGGNAASFAKARSVDWTAWRYTAIVIPGAGLEPGEVGVSPIGIALVEMAARRWHQGVAPFVLLSEGHVHPNRTPYAEAIEMKRRLMSRYGVPEDVIVIDPYARHTTTNLRNATRLLFRMGAPVDKPFVIATTADGTRYIASQEYTDRCRNELGYHPAEIIERTSPFDLVAKPNLLSLHADIQDPLDP